MNQSEELRMTYSGIITKKGQNIVHVFFERGKDYAEGSLPSGKIEKSSGFSPAELKLLSHYLLQNAEDIIEHARHVDPLRGFMGKTET